MQPSSFFETADRTVSRLLYDRYPYLATRLAPALYHLIPLPDSLDESSVISLARHQWLCNQLPTCLILAEDRCVYFHADGSEILSELPPRGGIPIAGTLRPARGLQQGSWWDESNERLVRDLDRRNKRLQGRFLLGDLTKGARPSTAEECQLLKGSTSTGIPPGLTECTICGEWKGKCLEGLAPGNGDWLRHQPLPVPVPERERPSDGDSHRSEGWQSPRKGGSPRVLTVSCRCDNDNRCAACYGLLYERKLNANYFSSSDGRVLHVPGFMACDHRCEGGGS